MRKKDTMFRRHKNITHTAVSTTEQAKAKKPSIKKHFAIQAGIIVAAGVTAAVVKHVLTPDTEN